LLVLKIFVFCLAWAVDLGVQITDVERSFYIGSFCPAMTSFSRYLEEAAFSISKSTNQHPDEFWKLLIYNGNIGLNSLKLLGIRRADDTPPLN
jgi:hypothetical protein